MNKNLPSPLDKWHKNREEMKALWLRLQQAAGELALGSTWNDLKKVTDNLPEIEKLVKTIERAQVANCVAKSAQKEAQ